MDNSDDEIINEMRDSSGFTKKQELKEEKRLKDLRLELIRRDSFEEVPLLNMTTFSGDNSKRIRHMKKESVSSSDGIKKSEIRKIAYDLTDDAVEKEKFFKVVKEVISGALLDQVLNIQNDRENDESNKYSKANISNRQAQVKFIQKCKEENVLALPMLNRLKNKTLILENYRMNDGISKALSDAIVELDEYIEIFGLYNNDISDEALRCIIEGVKANKYITTLFIKKNRLDQESIAALKDILTESTYYEGSKAIRISSQLKYLEIAN